MKDEMILAVVSGIAITALNILIPNKFFWKLAILDFSVIAIIALVEMDEDFKRGFQSVW